MARIATIVGGKEVKRSVAKATTAEASKVDKRSQVGAPGWVRTGRWVRVVSSNVTHIRYDKPRKKMHVRFKGNVEYVCDNFSLQRAVTYFNAPSIGKHHWKLRRAGFKFVKA